MRVIFTILLLLSLTIPIFQVKSNNPTDNAIDYIKEKVLDGNWGTIAKEVINISEKALRTESEQKKSFLARVSNPILTGYGVGYSSIGAAMVSWNNYRFERIDIVPILPLFIIVTILFQMIFHNYFYKNRNAILSVINMMLALSIFGNCIGHEYYSGYLTGILLFLIIQISYMIYFYWFPFKNITTVYDENQSS